MYLSTDNRDSNKNPLLCITAKVKKKKEWGEKPTLKSVFKKKQKGNNKREMSEVTEATERKLRTNACHISKIKISKGLKTCPNEENKRFLHTVYETIA